MKKIIPVLALALMPGLASAQSAVDRILFGTSQTEIEAKVNVVLSKGINGDSDARAIRAGTQQMAPSVEACQAKLEAAPVEGRCGVLKEAIACLKDNAFSNKYNLGAFYSTADAASAQPGCDASRALAELKKQKQDLPLLEMEQPGNPNRITIVPVAYNMAVLDTGDRPARLFVVRDLTPFGLPFNKDGRVGGDSLPWASLDTFGLGSVMAKGGQSAPLSLGKATYPIQGVVPGRLVGSARDTETVRLAAVFGVFVSPGQGQVMEVGMELNGETFGSARFRALTPTMEEAFVRYLQRANLTLVR